MSEPLRVCREDVGGFFVDDAGSVWQCIGYCDLPTAIFQRIKDNATEQHVTDCLNVQKFTRLVKEERNG